MIGTTRSLRVFAYAAPTDLRKGYDGLQALVVSELRRDPLSGDCFLFTNARRTRAKVLVWDGTGLCVCPTHYATSNTTKASIPMASAVR